MQLRFALFIVAWALVSLYWLSWPALPFQGAIALAVLWHAVRRERVLRTTAKVEHQLRETELVLASQNQQLRQLDTLKNEFIALVSHELRTPLTSIRGYLELMSEDTNLNDEQERFLDTIDRNAHRLQRVVGDLLFCAQVDAGKLTLEEGVVDLDTLIAEALETARPVAAARSIELKAELAELPELPGDYARLAQVIDNFISNALKFTPGGGRVHITTRDCGGEVELAISDTGMGIAASELPHLFQRFFRTESAASIPGTGLGLTISKAIVEGHGGRISVESQEGEGTTFRVFLPAEPTSAHTVTAIHGTPITSVCRPSTSTAANAAPSQTRR
jgi:signal transduction histidine kinase